jgi:hypothetical protein
MRRKSACWAVRRIHRDALGGARFLNVRKRWRGPIKLSTSQEAYWRTCKLASVLRSKAYSRMAMRANKNIKRSFLSYFLVQRHALLVLQFSSSAGFRQMPKVLAGTSSLVFHVVSVCVNALDCGKRCASIKMAVCSGFAWALFVNRT